MKLPNKVTSYKQSIISKFPIVLDELSERDLSVDRLYRKVEKKIDGPEEFIQVLDCLFYLGQLEVIKGGFIIHYVKRDILR